jgi:hypothetical protein
MTYDAPQFRVGQVIHPAMIRCASKKAFGKHNRSLLEAAAIFPTELTQKINSLPAVRRAKMYWLAFLAHRGRWPPTNPT